MGADIVSGGKRLLFLPNNDLFKLERKIAHEVLGPSQKRVFAPHQDLESRALLFEYLIRPEDWWLAHARYSSSVIMGVVFGRRTKLGDENVTNILNMGEKIFEIMQPGSNLVDAFPILAKVPLPKWMQPWRWTGDKYYQQTLAYGLCHLCSRQKEIANSTGPLEIMQRNSTQWMSASRKVKLYHVLCRK